MMKILKLKCQHCKTERTIGIDDRVMDPKKVKLLACFACDYDYKKKKFKEEDKRHMNWKEEKVDKIWIRVKIDSPKLHKYKEIAIPKPI